MDLSQASLGHQVDYPNRFDPGLLLGIPRVDTRSSLPSNVSAGFIGFDEWTLYELCWLNKYNSPVSAVARLRIPAHSAKIVESKSLKLYANSLFFKSFISKEDVENQLRDDLQQLLGGKVEVEISNLLFLGKPEASESSYQSLDNISVDISANTKTPVPELIGSASDFAEATSETAVEGAQVQIKRLYTHRFRSLCPVTGQPDWASVFITLFGADPSPESLARYLLAYAQHPGFHEQCVEKIYTDVQKALQPQSLCVAARFTRRGGIDINPVRASNYDVLELPGRIARQ